MNDTKRFFKELDMAEKSAAISMTMKCNVRSEILERDIQIVNMKAEIIRLRKVLNAVRTFPGTPESIAKLFNDALDMQP